MTTSDGNAVFIVRLTLWVRRYRYWAMRTGHIHLCGWGGDQGTGLGSTFQLGFLLWSLATQLDPLRNVIMRVSMILDQAVPAIVTRRDAPRGLVPALIILGTPRYSSCNGLRVYAFVIFRYGSVAMIINAIRGEIFGATGLAGGEGYTMARYGRLYGATELLDEQRGRGVYT